MQCGGYHIVEIVLVFHKHLRTVSYIFKIAFRQLVVIFELSKTYHRLLSLVILTHRTVKIEQRG